MWNAGYLLWDAAYDGSGTYIAVGPAGRIYTSTNGVTWTNLQPPSGAFYPYSVIYAQGKWVFGSDHGVYYYDGNTWTRQPIYGLRHGYRVAYGNGRFVVAGVGFGDWGDGVVVFASENGTDWTLTHYRPDPYYSTAYVGDLFYDAERGRFLVVGGTEGNNQTVFVLESQDGTQWQVYGDGAGRDQRAVGIACGGDTCFFQVSYKGILKASSPNIQEASVVVGEPTDIFGLTYGNGKFVGVGKVIASRSP
ncbi:hypothetical protein Thermus72351_20610 [Thermus brockianus]